MSGVLLVVEVYKIWIDQVGGKIITDPNQIGLIGFPPDLTRSM